ncbi:ATP-binding protein [Rhizobium sp. SL86]|uniref:ATP-binding protein n=1 Tax=Rhizobium sp. SL86 TaxID=2995148 RepID=UPI002274C155|nr:ATP-binding protein [Rhizobium sp. SL86]MCY1668606.1 ATP-binding protein [Rhizobium sp. SL86]
MRLSKPKVPDRSLFVEIAPVHDIRGGIAYARNFGWPTRIISPPGCGKTTALYYLSQELGGVYCHVGQAQNSTPDMYRMLLEAAGRITDKKFTRDLFAEVISTFEDRNWDGLAHERPRKLLVVDEVQNLVATAQRELLNIQETCNLALVMSGNGVRLAGSRIDKAAWEQIDSRVGMEIVLNPLTEHDCQLIASAYGVEGMDTYKAVSNYGTQTSARLLGQLLESAKLLTHSGGGIKLAHIRAVLEGNPKLGSPQLLKPEAA